LGKKWSGEARKKRIQFRPPIDVQSHIEKRIKAAMRNCGEDDWKMGRDLEVISANWK